VDPEDFIIFKDMCWGARALATDLTNKVNRGLVTIQDIVEAYAPASDNNNVPAYINALAAATGMDPGDPVIDYDGWLPGLMRAIMNHENGNSSMVSDATIVNGISLMGVQLSQLPQDAANLIEDNPGSFVVILMVAIGLLALNTRS